MYIEDVLAAKKPVMYGEYHPSDYRKSCVMVRGIGCVFIGSVDQCQTYIAQNESKYGHNLERGANPAITR